MDAKALHEAFTMGYKKRVCVAAKLCVVRLGVFLSACIECNGYVEAHRKDGELDIL
jgi:hypothetical protein